MVKNQIQLEEIINKYNGYIKEKEDLTKALQEATAAGDNDKINELKEKIKEIDIKIDAIGDIEDIKQQYNIIIATRDSLPPYIKDIYIKEYNLKKKGDINGYIKPLIDSISTLEEKIANAKKQLEDNKKILDETKTKLDDASKKIEESKKQLKQR